MASRFPQVSVHGANLTEEILRAAAVPHLERDRISGQSEQDVADVGSGERRLRGQVRQRAVIVVNSPDEKILKRTLPHVSRTYRRQLAPVPVVLPCTRMHHMYVRRRQRSKPELNGSGMQRPEARHEFTGAFMAGDVSLHIRSF